MRRVVALALLALLLAGCDALGSDEPDRRWPLATAGRACQLLDYDLVAAQLGTRFDTVGGAEKDATYTCALTQEGHEFPDLTLAVTASTADEVIFTATVTPSGSTAVKRLGRIAYRVDVPAAGRAGPGVEVGWLSAHERLLIIRYTFPPSTDAKDVDALASKLIALAKQVETNLAGLNVA